MVFRQSKTIRKNRVECGERLERLLRIRTNLVSHARFAGLVDDQPVNFPKAHLEISNTSDRFRVALAVAGHELNSDSNFFMRFKTMASPAAAGVSSTISSRRKSAHLLSRQSAILSARLVAMTLTAVCATAQAEQPSVLSLDDAGWSLHPWSHDFTTPADLDRWHAPDRSGGRDPDDRHIGKETRGPTGQLLDNTGEFAKYAYVDEQIGDGVLVMRSAWDPEAGPVDPLTGTVKGQARMPYLISYAAFDTLHPTTRKIEYYEPSRGVSRPCTTADGQSAVIPCDFILDPRDKELYVETRVNFEGAQNAFKAWWAFWLFAPYSNYDGDVDTGMEVDILEYVPDTAKDGFNAAMFRDWSGSLQPSDVPEGQSCDNNGYSDRGCDGFTANEPDTDAFLQLRNPDYAACRADESCPAIRLNEGFHRIGVHYTQAGYAFYIDDYKFWEVADPKWVTKQPKLGIQLTWEKDEGSVIDDRDKDGTPNYLEDGLGGAADGIEDWRQSSQGSSGLSYGPWGQGFGADIYDGECSVTVGSGSQKRRYETFDDARSVGIYMQRMTIEPGSCELKRYATAHESSTVLVDYMRVYMRPRR